MSVLHIPRKQEMFFFFSLTFSLLNCVFVNSRLDNLEDIFQPFVFKILPRVCVYMYIYTYICDLGKEGFLLSREIQNSYSDVF